MEDSEARSLVLRFFYDLSPRPWSQANGVPLILDDCSLDEFYRICQQLVEAGHLTWDLETRISASKRQELKASDVRITEAGMLLVEEEDEED